MRGEGSATGGLSAGQSLAYRAGARDLISLRFTPETELKPIQGSQPRFDARDFAVNVFVILFFALVLLGPLAFIIGAAIRVGG